MHVFEAPAQCQVYDMTCDIAMDHKLWKFVGEGEYVR